MGLRGGRRRDTGRGVACNTLRVGFIGLMGKVVLMERKCSMLG